MKNKRLILVLCFLLCFILFVLNLFMGVSASSNKKIPFQSYTYWEGYKTKKPIAIKEMYSVSKVIESNGEVVFDEIQHITFDKNDNLYVLDSTNSTISILDRNYKLLNKIEKIKYKGEELNFQQAKGIFIDEQNKIFIADTVNFRVIVLSEDYKIEKIIERPDSKLIPEDLNFSPIKLLKDKEGFLYVLCDGCYYGAMKFSSEYEFMGFYGANTVHTSVLSSVGNFISELFTTNAKRMNDIRKLPYTFFDFCIDEEGFIFTVTDSLKSAGTQVRRLGPKGNNMLSKKFNFKKTNGDDLDFGDIPGIKNEQNAVVKNQFCAVATEDKFFYLSDRASGRIFVYDFDCNLINIFSGGFGDSIQQGTCSSPSALAVNKSGDILVSDYSKKSITIFSLTDYGKAVKKAAAHNMNGEYVEAEKYWNQVLEQDENNQLAYIGLGKAALMQNDYETAIKYSKIGLDQETYSRAQGKILTEKLKENFVWIFLSGVLVISFIAGFLVITSKKNWVIVKNPIFGTALRVFFHPKESFSNLKEKKTGSLIIATVLLAVFFVVNVIVDIYTGFMYSVTDNDTYNVIYTFLGTVGILALWVVVNWGVCVLFEGKGKLKEIYISSCYCLIPLILYSVIFVFLSYFITPSEVSFMTLLEFVSTGYFAVLILVSSMIIHEFGFVRSILTSVCTVFGMLVVAFLVMMAIILCQDFISFIISIVQETMLR